MIARRNSDGNDSTPRPQGKLGGAPWTAVAHSDPVAWTNIGDFLDTPTVGTATRVSWEVRGRRTGSDPILSVGQAWVKENDGDSAIVETVETFADARVKFALDGSSSVMQVQSHLTEDWEFQVKLAYDLKVPVVP